MITTESVLGVLTLDWAGMMLGTGFNRFTSPFGVKGLAKDDAVRLDLLAVESTIPSTGQFKRFIQAAKEQYQIICIWHDWNPGVGPMLQRWGFQRYREQWQGEDLIGWRWDAGLECE
jgi:hypothetical protein